MKESRGGTGRERVAFYAFIASVAFAVFTYGYAVHKCQIFPYSILKTAEAGFLETRTQLLRLTGLSGQSEERLPWYYVRAKRPYPPPILNTSRAFPGVNLVTGLGPDLRHFAKILDMDGRALHEWNVDWFRIWPDASHLPEEVVPRSRPGAFIHGATVLGNGDLIFNFSTLGMVRLNRDSEVVWRLPYRTHHSLFMDEVGNLWTCGAKKRHEERDPGFPFRKPPFDEYTLLAVSAQGKILHEWSIPDILRKNNLIGLYEIAWTASDLDPNFCDDRLHLNDVEPFPAAIEEGFFKRGDVIVSLRNINTVFVFNRETEKIKYISTGRFVRQHDADFIDGNTYSVFDNGTAWRGSRIQVESATADSVRTAYSGSLAQPFFSRALGKHQWLPNGNLLVTDAMNGRGVEVDKDGKIVWEYRNYVSEGVLGAVMEVTRLPEHYAEIFR
jgi:hypothetical protein